MDTKPRNHNLDNDARPVQLPPSKVAELELNGQRNAARDSLVLMPATRRRTRHRAEHEVPEDGHPQLSLPSSPGPTVDEPLGEKIGENMGRLSSQEVTTARSSGTAIVKTVKTTCPKMDFTATIIGHGGSYQKEDPPKSDILAQFYYIIELPKNHEEKLRDGGVYDVISAMEKRMHQTLVNNLLDCSGGGVRRRKRRLGFGLRGDDVGQLRVVGVNSAPLDHVTTSVACTPTKKSRLCLGFNGAVTLTYFLEGDYEEEQNLLQEIENTRSHTVDIIRTSMEKGDYIDPSPVAPILRVSLVEAPIIAGLGQTASGGAEGGAPTSSLPSAPRSARYSRRTRAIVITAGILLLVVVYVLMVLSRRMKRRRGQGGKGGGIGATSTTDCSTEISTPERTAGQQSVMFVDSVREVWRMPWTNSEVEPCRTQERADSWIDDFGNKESLVSLGSNLSDDAVVTSPTHKDRDNDFGFLQISKSDSFVTRKLARKSLEPNTKLYVGKSDSFAGRTSSKETKHVTFSGRDAAESFIDKNSHPVEDSGVTAKPVRQDKTCLTEYLHRSASSEVVKESDSGPIQRVPSYDGSQQGGQGGSPRKRNPPEAQCGHAGSPKKRQKVWEDMYFVFHLHDLPELSST